MRQYDEQKRFLREQATKAGDEWVKEELDWVCEKLEQNMKRFGDYFPSACAEKGYFEIKDNDDWTNGFWTGMMWIAWLHTGKELFCEQAMRNVESFQKRLQDHIVLDHHDIGFLYTLSVDAGYRILGVEEWKKTILMAADVLKRRYQEKGKFIQAWGALDCANEYRLIIDSLLNLPLLYQAYHLSGEEEYKRIGDNHFKQVIRTIIREDFSTYHTFYFNPSTGEPSYGATHQGFGDHSCWARGQAWAILGIPLHLREDQEAMAGKKHLYEEIVNYYFRHLSDNGIPYWDLAFDASDEQPYDSSAAAIAACGLIEAYRQGCMDDGDVLARGMIAALGKDFTSKDCMDEGILLHGVYAYKEGKGVDQANLWGDYFYMEALYRLLNPEWKTFW